MYFKKSQFCQNHLELFPWYPNYVRIIVNLTFPYFRCLTLLIFVVADNSKVETHSSFPPHHPRLVWARSPLVDRSPSRTQHVTFWVDLFINIISLLQLFFPGSFIDQLPLRAQNVNCLLQELVLPCFCLSWSLQLIGKMWVCADSGWLWSRLAAEITCLKLPDCSCCSCCSWCWCCWCSCCCCTFLWTLAFFAALEVIN